MEKRQNMVGVVIKLNVLVAETFCQRGTTRNNNETLVKQGETR
jgi:hypothetical protein